MKNNPRVDWTRLDLTRVRFGGGIHDAPPLGPTGDRDMCIMEAVAYMAGEPWSDKPECASPVVSAFLRSWNDALSDEDRDRLLPAAVWVPRLVGSIGDKTTEQRRAFLALDWLTRAHAPAWLDLVPSLAPHAAELRALSEIADMETAENAVAVVRAARDAAYAAASDAVRASAWVAASDATRAAAGDAAWTAVRASARAAASAAAGDAAWAAARDALQPTVEKLQVSALDLLDRMFACGH